MIMTIQPTKHDILEFATLLATEISQPSTVQRVLESAKILHDSNTDQFTIMQRTVEAIADMIRTEAKSYITYMETPPPVRSAAGVFGKWLRAKREEQNKTAKDVASALEISLSFYNQVEAGLVLTLSMSHLSKICNLLQIDMQERSKIESIYVIEHIENRLRTNPVNTQMFTSHYTILDFVMAGFSRIMSSQEYAAVKTMITVYANIENVRV